MKLQRAFFVALALVFLVSFTRAVSSMPGGNQTAQVAGSSSQAVTSLILVNAETNADIGELTNGYVIDPVALGTNEFSVKAKTNPATVGSVKFNLDQTAAVVKSTSPYVVGPSTLSDGPHTLVATPYTLSRGRGTAGAAMTVNFVVGQSSADPHGDESGGVPEDEDLEGLAVNSFTLVNADTNQDIRVISDNEVIDIAEVGQNLNIRADTTVLPNLPGSVKFNINGSQKVENTWPFTLKPGSGDDDYLPWPYTLDTNYTVIAEPYTLTRARGEMGSPLTASFSFTDSSEPEGLVEGAPRSVVVENDVFLTAPAAGTNVSAGQTLPMTCEITTAPDQVVWKLSYSYYYGNPAIAGNFVTLDNLNYTTGSYTQNVTIIPTAPQGAHSLMCVAYFKSTVAPVVYTQDFATHNVTVGGSSAGTTDSISITLPASDYVMEGQSFNVGVTGYPSDHDISSVKFSVSSDGPAPTVNTISLGVDNTPTFSVPATLPERGIYILSARATLANGQTMTTTKEIFVTDYAMSQNNGSPTFKITQYSNCCPVASFSEDVQQTINYTTTLPAGVTFMGVDFYEYGGMTNFGGSGLNYLGSRTAANGTFTFTVNEPGAGIGQNSSNNIIIPIAFFSNTVTKATYFVKIYENLSENLPVVSSANIVNASGQNLADLTAGAQINIGTQGTGFGPNISVKANTGTVTPGSVKFTLTGPVGFSAHTQCENTAPYSLFSDTGGVYTTWPQPTVLGAYTLTITPYTASACVGSAGTALLRSFMIVNNDSTPPNPPSNLITTWRSANEIRISWTASTSPNVSGYKVYRVPGNPVTIGNVTTYTDTNSITNGGSYSYTVAATNIFGQESGVSTSMIPPNLSAAFTTGNTVELQSDYTPKVSPDGAAAGSAQTEGSLGTISGTPVYYSVGGSSAHYWNVNFNTGTDGYVPESELAIPVGNGPSVPVFVTTPTSVTRSESSITLDWNASTGSVSKYQIQVNANVGGTLIGTFEVNAPQTAETITGLSPVTYYDFKIRACDGAMNCSAWSPVLTANTWVVLAATAASNSAIPVTATAQSASPRVTLSWTGSGATTIYRKTPDATSWGASIGTSSNNQFQDTTALSGVEYEYRLERGAARGYISSGYNVSLPAYNGKIVVLVEQNLYNNASITAALNEFKADLKGDGWFPIVQSVSATASTDSVRDIVMNIYNTDPTNVKAVLLIGRVPVKLSGLICPDGHCGAGETRNFPADAFYADMDGTWSATLTALPDNVELQVGRIDLSGMPQLGSEVALTLAYFDKLHDFKVADFVPKARGIIFDNLTWAGNYAESAWKTIPPLVGKTGQTLINAPVGVSRNYDTHISDNSWLWGFGAGGGANDNFAEGPTTALYATKNMGAVFNMMFGSYFGLWTPNNNLLRAPLGQGAGLINAWASRPNWFFHQMGMGHNVGYSVKASMNNTVSGSVYQAVNGSGVHMGLMGDPTLRMNYFKPPTNLSVTSQSGMTKFDWTQSPESAIHYIYQINPSTGTMTVINNGNPVPGSSYVSSIPFSGGSEWVVRAEKTITTPSGHYKNLSLGAYAQAGAGAAPDTNPPSSPSGIAVSGAPTQTQIVLDWSDSTGNPVGESVFYKVYRNSGGATAISSTPLATGLTSSTYTNTGLTAGTTYLYRISSVDSAGNESTLMPALPGFSATTAAAAPTAPAAPTNLSGSATSSSQVNLSWTDNANNEATFTLELATNSGFTTGLTTVSSSIAADTTSYSVTGLTASTTYYFRVRAVNATGNSTWATSVAITTQASGGTGQVMGISGGVGPNNNENVTPSPNPYGATDYFVSSINGNDSNNGTSPATAWKTISRLNQLTTRPAGTRVFFHRGGRYNGAVMTYSSGTTNAPLEYGAYGSGAAPIISGATPITGTWTVDSGNVWKTTIATGLSPKYLVASGSIQTLARTPNTGWNFTDAVTGTSLTDSWVGTQATNSLVGADVVFRSSPWSWHKFPIASNNGNVIGFSGDTGNSPSFSGGYWEDTGWGYLVQDYRAGIDTPGEWYYNPTTGVLYFQAPGNVNPNTLSVEISTQDKGFAFYSINTDIKVKNLVLEFYNYAPIYSENAKRIAVENVEIRHAPEGIHVYNQNSAGTSQANSFKNSYVHDIYSDGIWSVSTSRDVYENNVIENIGMKPELGADGLGWNFFGTRLSGDYIFKRNIVKNVGYIGISAGGSGLVEENYVENALGTLGDGAGIAFDHSNGLIMRKNIVKDIAAEMSTMPTLYPGYIPLGKGIYFGDQDILNTSVDQNIVVNVESDGIWMDHGLEYVGNSVTNNVIYGFTRSGLGAGDFSAYRDVPNQNCSPNTNSPCFKVGGYNDVVTGNKVYGLAADQNPLYHQYSYSNGTGNHTDFGTYDNNYYYNPFRANKIQKVTFFNGQTNNYTLAQWQPLAPLYDQNSTASNYTLSDTNLAADIYYNATTTATTVNIGTGGCTATGAPMSANQTIQPFSAVVVEHRVGGC